MGLPASVISVIGQRDPIGGPMYTQHEVRLTRAYFIGSF